MKIPFTTVQFFEIIEKYNQAVFPIQIILIILGILTLFILHSKSKLKDIIIGSFLGALWIWIGIGYHLLFFTDINKMAYIFGGLFILQGLLFLFETLKRKKLGFEFKGNFIDYLAYFLIIFGIAIYPILIYILENSIKTTITLGLPCPSTIFTFGLILLSRPNFSKYLIIIPTIWTIIGTGAAINFGVYPDYLMPISALIAIIYVFAMKKSESN